MPSSLETPVLQVDTNIIHQVDTTNPENLFSMWTVFARCADSVAQGRRLENLSWRLWTRETFCCDSGEQRVAPSTTAMPKDINRPKRSSTSDDLPQLSGSVESVADEEAVEFTSESAPVDIIRPRIRRQDSCASSRGRGRERHITSDDLEKMVVSIVQHKEPLTAPLPKLVNYLPTPQPDKVITPPASLERSGSTSTESPAKTSQTPSLESVQPASSPELGSAHSGTMVVRGFSPVKVQSSQSASQALKSALASAIPEPREGPAPKIVVPRRQQPKFALGGSSGDESFSDQGRSLDRRQQPAVAPAKLPILSKKMFQVGGSSEEESSLKSAFHSPRPGSLLSGQKKQTSFANQVTTRTIPTSSSAISDDDQSETDYVDELDESAIDDDEDASEWEDSDEASGKSSVDDITFKRVDSKANLTSRRSLITLMLTQNDRAQMLSNQASQSTSAITRTRPSPNGPSLVASPNDSDDAPLMMKRGGRGAPLRPINEIPRSVAQPIMTLAPPGHHQAALSPRAIRKNMLATELTESLRRHLLWERCQKTSTAHAVLKRRHTAHDVANLQQYPERPYPRKSDKDVNASSWNQYLTNEESIGYNAQGW